MNLKFEESANRIRCGCKVLVNGSRMQCAFSSSKTVTIPEGWQFFNGKLKPSDDTAETTFSICQNHEARLKIAVNELSNRESIAR
jgi:hypothetical protein